MQEGARPFFPVAMLAMRGAKGAGVLLRRLRSGHSRGL